MQSFAPTRQQIAEELLSQQSFAVTQILPLTNQVDAAMESSFAESNAPVPRGGQSFQAKSTLQGATRLDETLPDDGPVVEDVDRIERSDSFFGNIGQFQRGADDARASMVSAASSSLGIRKDPNLEFFQMLLLSYKMNNQDLEEVMELDHREMYLKCTKEEKVTFFHFPDWIGKEIAKIRFRKVYH